MPFPINLNYSEKICYEKFFNDLDEFNEGMIRTDKVSRFFQQSGLPNAVLAEIWDLCKPENARGGFDRISFYVGLRLIALAQHQTPLTSYMGEDSAPLAYIDLSSHPKTDSGNRSSYNPYTGNNISTSIVAWDLWRMTNDERERYFSAFNNLNPLDGFLSNLLSRDFISNRFGLSLAQVDCILSKVDAQRVGYLDFDAFASAMHMAEGAARGLLVITSSNIEQAPIKSNPTLKLQPTQEERNSYISMFYQYVQQHPSLPFVTYEQAADILSSCQLNSVDEAISLWKLANSRNENSLDMAEFISLMHILKLRKENDVLSINELERIKGNQLQSHDIASSILSLSTVKSQPVANKETANLKNRAEPSDSLISELKRTLEKRSMHAVQKEGYPSSGNSIPLQNVMHSSIYNRDDQSHVSILPTSEEKYFSHLSRNLNHPKTDERSRNDDGNYLATSSDSLLKDSLQRLTAERLSLETKLNVLQLKLASTEEGDLQSNVYEPDKYFAAVDKYQLEAKKLAEEMEECFRAHAVP